MTGEAATAGRAGHRDAPVQSVAAVLARAAWLAILLGLTVQILVLLAKIAAGGQSNRVQLIVDVASGVTWSALVCSGVAIGTVLSRHRAAMMGLLGLVSAPVAWAAAKGVQRGLQSMLSVPVGPWSTRCSVSCWGDWCARRPRRCARTCSPACWSGSPSAA